MLHLHINETNRRTSTEHNAHSNTHRTAARCCVVLNADKHRRGDFMWIFWLVLEGGEECKRWRRTTYLPRLLLVYLDMNTWRGEAQVRARVKDVMDIGGSESKDVEAENHLHMD